jgi:hypothetical protein
MAWNHYIITLCISKCKFGFHRISISYEFGADPEYEIRDTHNIVYHFLGKKEPSLEEDKHFSVEAGEFFLEKKEAFVKGKVSE